MRMISDGGDFTCKDGKIEYHIAMTMVITCQIDWIVLQRTVMTTIRITITPLLRTMMMMTIGDVLMDD